MQSRSSIPTLTELSSKRYMRWEGLLQGESKVGPGDHVFLRSREGYLAMCRGRRREIAYWSRPSGISAKGIFVELLSRHAVQTVRTCISTEIL